MSQPTGNKWLAPLMITIIGGIVVGVVVYWGTEGLPRIFGSGSGSGNGTSGPETPDGPDSTPTPTPTPTPAVSTPGNLPFLQRLAGNWKLQSWTEAGGPVTLSITVERGTMKVATDGTADWRLDIDERGENHTPQPAITCGARATLGGRIEAQPGGERNRDIDWTTDLHSVDHSSTGEGWIRRAMCGWTVVGGRYPFTVKLGGDPTRPATQMEMSNQWGTFVWVR